MLTCQPFMYSTSVASSLIFHLLFSISLVPVCNVLCGVFCGVFCVLLCCVAVCVCGCVSVCVGRGVGEGGRVCIEHAPVCRIETSPCLPAPRVHVFQPVGVVPVHTGTF